MDNHFDMGLHDFIGEDFLSANDTNEPLFNGQGLIDFQDNFENQGDEDFLSLGLAAFEDDFDEQGPPQVQSNAFGRSFSMNDLQSMNQNTQPGWAPSRQVSAKPTLQSVPEGRPSQGHGPRLGGQMPPAMPQPEPMAFDQAPPSKMTMKMPPGPLNQQQNYSYMQFAGAPSRSSYGVASSSESGPDGESCGHDIHSTTDGPYLAPSGTGSLANSRPSYGNLAMQMDNQLQIKQMKSEGNLAGIVGPMDSGPGPSGDSGMQQDNVGMQQYAPMHHGGIVTPQSVVAKQTSVDITRVPVLRSFGDVDPPTLGTSFTLIDTEKPPLH
eukprot:gene26986-9001_t